MSQENLELFRRGLAAWNDRDIDAIVALCHPNVSWTFSDRLPDAVGHIQGQDAVRDFLTRFTEDWSEISMVADQLIEAGENIVADVRVVAKGRDGIEVSLRLVHVWTVRNGQVVRFRGYTTLAQALEAVNG